MLGGCWGPWLVVVVAITAAKSRVYEHACASSAGDAPCAIELVQPRSCTRNALPRSTELRARRGAEVGCKVVAKACPEEKVGVFATKAGGLHVLEYSELEPAKASALDPATGQLYYNWSNICMHYFSVAFLNKVGWGIARRGEAA
jgi:hypothetical protein